MTDDHLTRLELLILARLATSGRRVPSVRKLETELYRFVDGRLSAQEWSLQCEHGLTALARAGDIDDRRAVLPQGITRLCDSLGVNSLPQRWSKVWRALMPALALQLPGKSWSSVASADKLRARLIRQDRGLEIDETPTLTQAVDAQVWQALGVPEAGKLTLGKLRRVLLERALGTPLRAKSIEAADAGQWLATAAAGTTTRNIAGVQRELVSRWVFDGGFTAQDEPPESEASAEAPTPSAAQARTAPAEAGVERGDVAVELSPQDWAAQVQALAEATTAGRYGDERIFIATVWQAAQAGPLRTSLVSFKERLVEANRLGLLRLHRADLVGAMDGALVEQSEARHLNATFHFIEIAPPRTV